MSKAKRTLSSRRQKRHTKALSVLIEMSPPQDRFLETKLVGGLHLVVDAVRDEITVPGAHVRRELNCGDEALP